MPSIGEKTTNWLFGSAATTPNATTVSVTCSRLTSATLIDCGVPLLCETGVPGFSEGLRATGLHTSSAASETSEYVTAHLIVGLSKAPPVLHGHPPKGRPCCWQPAKASAGGPK